MAFRWLDFVRRYNIEYVTEGSSVSRGNINIRCPLCGNADPSHHMGLALDKSWWACWRDRGHRGAKPNYLIRVLLGCSQEDARQIAEEFGGSGSNADVLDAVRDMDRTVAKRRQERALEMPEEFMSLMATGRWYRRTEPYRKYIVGRGFPPDDVHKLADIYDLRAAIVGEYHDRLILPVYYQGLATWTGRSIFPAAGLRYKTLSTDAAKAGDYKPARYKTSDLVYLFDQLYNSGGEVLHICEGPLDALKLDFYGRSLGQRATCLFGLNLSDHQRILLNELRTRFEKCVLLLDNGAASQHIQMTYALSDIGAEIRYVPSEYKDPGEMPKSAIREYFRSNH